MPKSTTKSKDVTATRRGVMQQAKLAVRDVFDAAVELITNADDRYQILGKSGRIDIEVERKQSPKRSVFRIRDFADGMTTEDMDHKLSETGGRVSGLESGAIVRGTNSRGAKDVAALGRVTFESIAGDGQYHKCEISEHFKYTSSGAEPVNPMIRASLGIPKGTGTVVTIELDLQQKIPTFENLTKQLENLVCLRDVIANSDRRISVQDIGPGKQSVLRAQKIESKDRVKVALKIPDYPDASAKLVIKRAKRPFDQGSPRFRKGGILIKSSHAIHEATLFDSALERDPHARWFTGKLTCAYIDKLWNDFDDRFEANEKTDDPKNPFPIIDPSRRGGLTKNHPFVEALFGEALKHLRPLVAQEKQLAENSKASIENRATRKRLDALERAAMKFMEELGEDDDTARDDATKERGSKFVTRGYSLSPPYTKMVVGQSVKFRLNVRQEAFPELQEGSSVEVHCMSPEIEANKRFAPLEPHPNQDGVLQARWSVKGMAATQATGLGARVGPIRAESMFEVFETEADMYAHIDKLQISKRNYRVKMGKRKTVKVMAPLSLVGEPKQLEVKISSSNFKLSGERVIRPVERFGIAVCDLHVVAGKHEAKGTIEVSLDGAKAEAQLEAIVPEGAGIEIKLEDDWQGNQRYMWKQNTLAIYARHPSLARYLGPAQDDFPGQNERHFRAILAEIVTEAVCAKLLAMNIKANKEDFEDADWDYYYAEFTKLSALFGPIAHKVQLPD